MFKTILGALAKGLFSGWGHTSGESHTTLTFLHSNKDCVYQLDTMQPHTLVADCQLGLATVISRYFPLIVMISGMPELEWRYRSRVIYK